MDEWWYVFNNNKQGPVSEDVLKSLLLSSKITSDTLVWKEGELAWNPIREYPILTKSLPPPIPSANQGEILKKAGIVPRILARFFDILLASIFCSSTYIIIIRSGLITLNSSDNLLRYFLLLILLNLSFFIFDAIIYALFKVTLFRKILGIKIKNLENKSISKIDYLIRNIKFFFFGYACGIPMLSIIFSIVQIIKIKNTGTTSYDHENNIVESKRSFLRWFSFIIFAVILLVVNGTLMKGIIKPLIDDRIAELKTDKRVENNHSNPWKNNYTGMTISIPERWNIRNENLSGNTAYLFTDTVSHLNFSLSIDSNKNNKKIDDLILSLTHDSNFNFDDKGEYQTTNNVAYWTGFGHSPNSDIHYMVIIATSSRVYAVFFVDVKNANKVDLVAFSSLIEQISTTF